MDTTQRSFHVVCRECRTERVLDTVADAAEFADEHAAETDHVVVFDRIQ
ncbi:hypothetical protein [Halorubrum sp. DTA98]